MGYADRDYYRDGPQRPSSRFADIPVVKWLLISNIVIFVLGSLMKSDPRDVTVFDEWGVFSIKAGLQQMQVWRLLTFQFLHDGFFHLLFNMWVLFVFGPFLERWWRSKAFLLYYLLCGVAGAAFYSLLVVVPGILPTASVEGGLVGASAGILGVLVGVAILAPRAEVRLMLPPVTLKLKTLAMIMIGLDVLMLLMNSSNAGGSAGHLGGVLMGLLLMKNPLLRGLLVKLATAKGVSVKIVKKPKPESKFKPKSKLSGSDSSEVDRILDKINNEGLQSLTDEERELLKRAAGEVKARCVWLSVVSEQEAELREMRSEEERSMNDDEMMNCSEKGRQVERLRAIMTRLRAPGGCPWDAEQTHESLVSNLIEETYETVDTIQRGDMEHLKEELGDLLLQVVFHSELEREAGNWDMDEVARGISEKLVRRHPHVFATSEAGDSEAVLKQWDEIKRAEKGDEEKPFLHGVGKGLPALLRAAKLQKKAAKVGFDWPDAEGILEKVEEELEETREELKIHKAGEQASAALESEVGDLLFVVVNLARKLGIDPEVALEGTNVKFTDRFGSVESGLKEEGQSLEQADLGEMERRWQMAKERGRMA